MFPLLYIYSDWGLFVARVILGIVMMVHGWPKLKDLKGTAGWMQSVGFKPGIVFAVIAAILEFFGGLLLILGLLTQIVAVLIVIQFVILVLWKLATHHKLAGDLEVDLFILILALILATSGPGAFALDTLLFL